MPMCYVYQNAKLHECPSKVVVDYRKFYKTLISFETPHEEIICTQYFPSNTHPKALPPQTTTRITLPIYDCNCTGNVKSISCGLISIFDDPFKPGELFEYETEYDRFKLEPTQICDKRMNVLRSFLEMSPLKGSYQGKFVQFLKFDLLKHLDTLTHHQKRYYYSLRCFSPSHLPRLFVTFL